MKTYVGVLGDPAKSDLYGPEFYQILDWDENSSSFHLLGASENNLDKSDYRLMFDKFEQYLGGKAFQPIPDLSPAQDTTYTTRVGLFPSSSSHLIDGPGFSFAPYPVNSKSRYLKAKSKLLQFILSPFLPFVVRSLAYLPLGGKAAKKTRAELDLSDTLLAEYFYRLRSRDKFDWYYLEAGSGEASLALSTINQVLLAQYNALRSRPMDADLISDHHDSARVVVPRSIYGGGIRSIEQVCDLLEPIDGEVKLIPELVIIGNLSEYNISKTYELVEKIGELNEISTTAIGTRL